MKTFEHIQTQAGLLAVRFISHAFGESHYGVSLRGGQEARITVAKDGRFTDQICADLMPKDYGFTEEDARIAVAEFRSIRFDADVREIHRLGMMEFADAETKKRASELNLSERATP